MKNKFIATIVVAALAITTATSAIALTKTSTKTATKTYNSNYGRGCGGGGYSMMWDANGNFVDKDVFTKNLDQAIKDGDVASNDRDYYAQMYDYCVSNNGSGGRMGGRGGCGGRGRF